MSTSVLEGAEPESETQFHTQQVRVRVYAKGLRHKGLLHRFAYLFVRAGCDHGGRLSACDLLRVAGTRKRSQRTPGEQIPQYPGRSFQGAGFDTLGYGYTDGFSWNMR